MAAASEEVLAEVALEEAHAEVASEAVHTEADRTAVRMEAQAAHVFQLITLQVPGAIENIT